MTAREVLIIDMSKNNNIFTHSLFIKDNCLIEVEENQNLDYENVTSY